MSETRHAQRESCYARVIIENIPAYGHVADISPGGMKVRIPGLVPPEIAEKEILLIAFEDLGVEPFSLLADLKWSREETNSTLFGFSISEFADDECRRRFETLRSYYECMDARDPEAVENK